MLASFCRTQAEPPPDTGPAPANAARKRKPEPAWLRPRDTLGEGARITKVAFSPDSKLFASVDHWAIQLWDLATRSRKARFQSPLQHIDYLAFTPDGKALVATGAAQKSRNAKVVLWEVATGAVKWATPLDSDGGHSVAITPDGKTVVVATVEDPVTLFDRATGRKVGALKGPVLSSPIAVSGDGRWVAAADRAHELVVWDLASGRIHAYLKGHTKPVWALAFSPDGKTLVSAGEDDDAIAWDIAAAKVKQTFRTARLDRTSWVRSLAFSPDGKTVALIGRLRNIALWDLETGEARADFAARLPEYEGWTVAFSPDGKTLATDSASAKGILLWDVPPRKPKSRP
jgi:WD40 repeat protein